MEPFDQWTVVDLKRFLVDRGVSVTDYKKDELIKLCKCVRELRLPADPDHRSETVSDRVHHKLSELGIDIDPLVDKDFSSELDFELDFSLYDVFNYLVYSQCDYDRQKLKSYKAFDEYRLYADGYVTRLELKRVDLQQVVFRAAIKPTQKDKTQLKTDAYRLWVVVDSTKGLVSAAYCQCTGGYVAISLFF
jgi:hypothetical protein